MATPLCVVRIILLSSFFNSLMAWNSSLVMFDFGICVFLSMFLTSTLSSSASPWFNYEQACSMATMYSPLGGHLVITMKFGLWTNRSLGLLSVVYLTNSWPMWMLSGTCVCICSYISFIGIGMVWAATHVWADTWFLLVQGLKFRPLAEQYSFMFGLNNSVHKLLALFHDVLV